MRINEKRGIRPIYAGVNGTIVRVILDPRKGTRTIRMRVSVEMAPIIISMPASASIIPAIPKFIHRNQLVVISIYITTGKICGHNGVSSYELENNPIAAICAAAVISFYTVSGIRPNSIGRKIDAWAMTIHNNRAVNIVRASCNGVVIAVLIPVIMCLRFHQMEITKF